MTSHLQELSSDVKVAKEATESARVSLAGAREQAETILGNLSPIGLDILQKIYGNLLDELEKAIEVQTGFEAQMHRVALAVQAAGG